MKAIDNVVQSFLEQPSEKEKVVINLGCGFDPLPWQCFTRLPSACERTVFIDVDYRDLMLRKRAIVQETVELNSMLTNVRFADGNILLQSDQYIQLGCDLRDLKSFTAALASALDVETRLVLLTAEVSITYMTVQGADDLIKWAGTLHEGKILPMLFIQNADPIVARFCLLEQLLPDETSHPFSQMMMTHFRKLQTPLQAVEKYPTIEDQRGRFQALGWPRISIRNLWELWSASDFATAPERKYLDSIEAFDEWEEFALFGCHYFLLVADTSKGKSEPDINLDCTQYANADSSVACKPPLWMDVAYGEYPKAQGCRRFAAAIPVRGGGRSDDRVGNFGGMGLVTRLNSYDVYARDLLGRVPFQSREIAVPSSRMCHTTTDLADLGTLLVGGRTSPDNALADCWLYHKWIGLWERVDDLPRGLYRHQAVGLGEGCVLISTGRIDSKNVSQEYLVWSRRQGWMKCIFNGREMPHATYGAVFSKIGRQSADGPQSLKHGILAGGMGADGLLQQQLWQWELRDFSSEVGVIVNTLSPLGLANYDMQRPLLFFQPVKKSEHNMSLFRFGANAVTYDDQVYIFGGVVKDNLLKSSHEVLALRNQGSNFITWPVSVRLPLNAPRPLLIGSTIVVAKNSIIIMGGSAVCFSFGTFWNKGCFSLRPLRDSSSYGEGPVSLDGYTTEKWKYTHSVAAELPINDPRISRPVSPANIRTVKIPRVGKPLNFHQIMLAAQPVIFEDLGLGSCTSKWTTEYLKHEVGAEREVRLPRPFTFAKLIDLIGCHS